MNIMRFAIIASITTIMMQSNVFAEISIVDRGTGSGHWLSLDGRPTALIGDSVTQGWMETGINFDHRAYVNALSKRGIHCLMIWSFIGPAPDDSDTRIGYDSPDLSPWEKTSKAFMRWDLKEWNKTYWRRLRELAELCHDSEIALLITVFDGWTKTRFDTHPFNQKNGGPLHRNADFVTLESPDVEFVNEAYSDEWSWEKKNQWSQERFAQKLIQELRGYDNIVFELFNEGEWYNPEARASHERHFAKFFHDRGALVFSNVDHISNFDGRSNPNIHVLTIHKPRWDDHPFALTFFSHIMNIFLQAPAKPVFFSEPVPSFEGGELSLDTMTRLLWGSMFGGACGAVVQNDLSFGFDPNTAVSKQAADRDAMLDREGICSRFWNEKDIPFWQMTPTHEGPSHIAMRRGDMEFIAYAQNTDRYLFEFKTQKVYTYQTRLLDPKTGESSWLDSIEGKNGRIISLPQKSDWVLHFRVQESNTKKKN